MTAGLRSILARIVALHVMAVVATSIVIVGTISLLLNSTLSTFELRALHQHEIVIAAALTPTRSGLVLNLPSRVSTRYAQHDEGLDYAVLDAGGRVLFAPSFPAHPLIASQPGRTTFLQRGGPGGLYAAASFPERRRGAAVTIQVAQDLGNPDIIADDIVAVFLKRVLWLLVLVLTVLVLVDVIIVRRALAPVIDASRLAQSIDPRRIDLRLPTRNLPREVSPLVDAVNHALDRLEDGFRTQREFTADAAHELRTPLSILRMRIEALCDTATARALYVDLDVMARIVGQLLAMAELEVVTVQADQRADLLDVCRSVAGYLAPLAVAQRKDLILAGPDQPVWVRGDPELLFQAVRNLAENAIAHTPEATSVEIDVSPGGVATIRDEGRGIPAEEHDLIFRRFWRGERQSSRGAGLGLSIVARILEAHQGGICVRNRGTGGAEFEIRLNCIE